MIINRKGDLSIYYRKFFCDCCKKYSIRMHIDNVIECENDCEIGNSKLDINNYKGFYSREEITDIFYMNEFDLIDKMLLISTGWKYEFKNLSKKESSRINQIFKEKNYTEVKIDDLVINYLIKKNLIELPKEISNYGYIINLIEDIHYYLLRACQDIILYDIALDVNQIREESPFYSARFFFYNAIESVWYAYERIMVFSGIKFNYPFTTDFIKHKTHKIIDFLKKDESFKASELSSQLTRFIGSSLNFINGFRETNTHDVSAHVKEINQKVNDEKTRNLIMNNNANSFDENYLKPKVNNVIKSIESLYDILLLIIQDISLDCNQFDNKYLPMKEEFEKGTLVDIDTSEKFNLSSIGHRKMALFRLLSQLDRGSVKRNAEIQLLWDVFFRLEEIQKCIVDAYNQENKTLRERWFKNIGIDISHYIDEKMFIYAGMSRIFSVLDKFSHYYASKYHVNKLNYFIKFTTLDKIESESTLNKAIDIANGAEYNTLCMFRNRIAHNLSAGALFGKEGIKHDNYYIYYCMNKLLCDCLDLVYFEGQTLLTQQSTESK